MLILPLNTLAHPGRTDSYGCHTCKTNCAQWGLDYGEYHCHKAKELPQPEEPVKSHYSETGGYTTPAPEYANPGQPVTEPAAQDNYEAPQTSQPSQQPPTVVPIFVQVTENQPTMQRDGGVPADETAPADSIVAGRDLNDNAATSTTGLAMTSSSVQKTKKIAETDNSRGSSAIPVVIMAAGGYYVYKKIKNKKHRV